ncbi:MAG: protein kinase [Planctomycetes bacterium]|nr:protein kinase [Planctomycetota bacterium]
MAEESTSSDEDPILGKLIDGCRVERKIGQGGMGVVYLATQESSNKAYCIKILNPALTGSEDTVERFFREAQACAQLNHPQIVGIQNVGQEGEYYYIRMEYIDGTTLEEMVVDGKPLDWKLVTRWILDTAEALAHAHGKGMIHRDIKPENIMLASDDTVKVMDFGLAKHVHSSTKVSVTGQIVGTPFFMSPEQAGGKPTDARSDIYSLGVTLYYLVTGVKPFNGKNLQEIFLKHFFYAPESPKVYNAELPESLCEVVKKCLKKKKKERYQSAKALARDLAAVLEDPSAALAEGPGGTQRAPRPARQAPSGGKHAGDLDQTIIASEDDEGNATINVTGGGEGATINVAGGGDGATVQVGGDPTMRVGGEGSDATIRVGDEDHTIAVGQEQNTVVAGGNARTQVASVQFRSASMIMNPDDVTQSFEIDDDDDPTAGLDLPAHLIGGGGKDEQRRIEEEVAGVSKGGMNPKLLIVIGLVLLIPALVFGALTLTGKHDPLLALKQERDALPPTVTGPELRALAQRFKLQLDAIPDVSDEVRAEALSAIADLEQRAKAAEGLSDFDPETPDGDELTLEKLRAKLEAGRAAMGQLSELSAQHEWAAYVHLVNEIITTYRDVPDLSDEIDALRVPVVVYSDPPGAKIFLGASQVHEERTQPAGTGVVWVRPHSRVEVRVEVDGFEPFTAAAEVGDHLQEWDAELKRKVLRTLDLGRIQVNIGGRDVPEPVVPAHDPVLDPARGGTVFFVGHDGALRGFNLQREAQEWEVEAVHQIGVYGDPTPEVLVLPGQLVIAGSSTGRLIAMDPANPTDRLWTRNVGSPITSPATFHPASKLVAVGTEDGDLLLLGAEQGKVAWRFSTENRITTPATFLGTSTLFVGSTDNSLYALDWQRQTKLGQLDMSDDVVAGPVPVGAQRLVLATADGRLHVVGVADPAHMERIASIQLHGSIGALKVIGNRIFVTAGRELWAFSFSENTLKPAWEKPWAGPADLTAPAVADGVIYVGTAVGVFFALDSESGEVLWKHREDLGTGHNQTASAPVVLDDQVFVFTGSRVTSLPTD